MQEFEILAARGKGIRALLTDSDSVIDTRYGRSFKGNFGSFLFSNVKGSRHERKSQ